MRHLFYVNPLPDRIFLEVLAKRPALQATLLEQTASGPDLERILQQSHVYQVGSMRDELVPHLRVTPALLARSPSLLAVSTHGAGYDTVDVKACTEAGVLAVNQAGGNAEAVAEHALGMMLCLAKRIIETDRYMRRQDGIPRADFIGHNLVGKTVGIIGIGHVGTRLAELCGGLFRMTVLAADPYLSAEQVASRGAQQVQLDELLERSDFVSINCPLTSETRGILSVRQYRLMKPGAYLVSTARGSIHDEDALVAALQERRIAGAGLDVWEQEPPPSSHPLLKFDNVLVSPHTAGVTVESRRNIATIAAQQIFDILDGKRPPRLLNPEVWPAFRKRFERMAA